MGIDTVLEVVVEVVVVLASSTARLVTKATTLKTGWAACLRTGRHDTAESSVDRIRRQLNLQQQVDIHWTFQSKDMTNVRSCVRCRCRWHGCCYWSS